MNSKNSPLPLKNETKMLNYVSLAFLHALCGDKIKFKSYIRNSLNDSLYETRGPKAFNEALKNNK